MLDEKRMQSALQMLDVLRHDLLEARRGSAPDHPRYQSLLNLRQYLILRSSDWTQLQASLFLLSLSSLGRSYAHVAASVDTLHDQLASSLGLAQISAEEAAAFHHLGIAAAQEMIARNSRALFGGSVPRSGVQQRTAVMVTLPSTAHEQDGHLIRGLARAGVNVFRINTAHDTPEVWRAMADVIARLNAQRAPEEALKIFVDLAGPKIRTGAIRTLKMPVVLGGNRREKPVMIVPAPAQTRPERVDPLTLEKLPAQLAVDPALFESLSPGDRLRLHGMNDKHAHLVLTRCAEDAMTALISKKIAIDDTSTISGANRVSLLHNCVEQSDPIRLFKGDLLRITALEETGSSAITDAKGNLVAPAQIPCTLEGFVRYVRPGERIYIDDGKIGLFVNEVETSSVLCTVTQAKINGTLLKAEKGINLPDSHLDIPALTPADKTNLLRVKSFADMLGLSFCQQPEDVRSLKSFLQEHHAGHIGIVPKIETREGVLQVPEILEALLECERSGVMIARGDLAIEAGFENLASIQESLLDICSAAHIPVIWATQVLESQMKNNLPSRAEITDAAMAGRAECVMLNKGPFAIDTIGALLRILDRMHQSFWKNRQMLRQETLWEHPGGFWSEAGTVDDVL